MSRLIFNNAAFIATDTYGDCIKLQPVTNYIDSIYRDNSYIGQTQKSIKVVNSCSTSYTIPTQNLFSDTLNGGNFIASIASILIPGHSTVDIPVLYTGAYKGSADSPSYTISLNGSNASYTLTILTSDTPPTTSDKTIALANREDTVITKTSLNYSDVDGIGTVTHARFTGDISRLYTDVGRTILYVAGTELPIDSFILYYKAPSQDAASSYEVQFNVKASGIWST